jgi:hypothetical protein
MKLTAFEDNAPCSFVELDCSFGSTYCHHHQGDSKPHTKNVEANRSRPDKAALKICRRMYWLQLRGGIVQSVPCTEAIF